MTTLFFATSLLFSLLAWNLYHPRYHGPKLAALSFMTGWLTGELALHVIFWQILLVAFYVLIGAVWGFFGALGFLICIASWLGMAFYYYESGSARSAVNSALESDLGSDFLEDIPDAAKEQFPGGPDRELILHPFNQKEPMVETIKDIGFGDFRQTLDIRRPRGKKLALAPVLLQIHGGAWTEKLGSKNEQALPLMNHMAKRGWICVASSYRLSPTATFPEHIIDCKQALVWIKKHIAEYGGDPDFIVTTGGSAGGHLSALMALSANHEPFQPGFEDLDTSLQGAVPFYGIYDFSDSYGFHKNPGLLDTLENSVMKLDLKGHEKAYQQASPLFHVNEKAPPFMIIHGDKDTLAPVEGGRQFAESLRAVSKNKVVYLEVPGAQHAFDMFPSLRSEHVKHGVEQFLTWTHGQYQERNSD